MIKLRKEKVSTYPSWHLKKVSYFYTGWSFIIDLYLFPFLYDLYKLKIINIIPDPLYSGYKQEFEGSKLWSLRVEGME